MPKFNMSWIYGAVIVGLLAVWFFGGDSVTGSASKQVSYTVFKEYVNNGYASKIIVNKDESEL